MHASEQDEELKRHYLHPNLILPIFAKMSIYIMIPRIIIQPDKTTIIC